MEVRALLRSLELEGFADLLVAEGFDSLHCLRSLQLEDLLAMGFKRGHARTLLTTLQAALTADAASPSSSS